MTFAEAYKRLQEIHQLLQSDVLVDVEEIVKLQDEAKICYDLCASKIQSTHNSVSA